jgi:hypothetical protein
MATLTHRVGASPMTFRYDAPSGRSSVGSFAGAVEGFAFAEERPVSESGISTAEAKVQINVNVTKMSFLIACLAD